MPLKMAMWILVINILIIKNWLFFATQAQETSSSSYGLSSNQPQCTISDIYRTGSAELVETLQRDLETATSEIVSATMSRSGQPLPRYHFCSTTELKTSDPRDCLDIQTQGNTTSGTYTIYPLLLDFPVHVYCDMETDGGGWTVFQRRQDGSVDFYRDWNAYRVGFGNVEGEHWLGNDLIHAMTNANVQELRIDLGDWEGNSAYAKYERFHVDSESNKFRLTVTSYSGTARDAIDNGQQNGMPFSTFDNDNDLWSSNCARHYQSAFWFSGCFQANLNGPYQNSSTPHDTYRGISWDTWRSYIGYSLRFSEMKMRSFRWVLP